jgi:hypothetical protein
VLLTELVYQPVIVQPIIMKFQIKTNALHVLSLVLNVLVMLTIVLFVKPEESTHQNVIAQMDIMLMLNKIILALTVTIDVLLVLTMLKTVSLVLLLVKENLKESLHQLVVAQLDLSMIPLLKNVSIVLSCVLNVLLTDVSNVVVTESPLVMNVIVPPDTMKMPNVNVQHVITNVLNVLLIPNVPFVLLTEFKN